MADVGQQVGRTPDMLTCLAHQREQATRYKRQRRRFRQRVDKEAVILTPITRWAPKALKIHPPATAPTIPRMISRKKPSPCLFTILLAIKPASKPSTIHARNDIFTFLQLETKGPQATIAMATARRWSEPVRPCARSQYSYHVS